MKFDLSFIYLLTIFIEYAISFKTEKTRKTFSSFNLKVEEKNKFNLGFNFAKFGISTEKFNKFYEIKKDPEKQVNKQVPKKKENLQASLKKSLNEEANPIDSRTFRSKTHKKDYKILDRQLEQLFATILYSKEDKITPNSLKSFFEIFISDYEKCDRDKNNVLDIKEFRECMNSDVYLSQIIPPVPVTGNYTSEKFFYGTLFSLLDDRNQEYINFVGYIKMRLAAFSWKECMIFAPYIDEVGFECAIEIFAGYKTFPRSTMKNIYIMALKLSNNRYQRNLNFISYYIVADSIRLYASINGKEDNDLVKSEFNLALDINLLPIRYNQNVINQFFEATIERDKANEGIDVQSFVYYDFCLDLFNFQKNLTRPYHLNYNEFVTILVVDSLFPNKTLQEIFNIPQYDINSQSYNMYESFNLTRFPQEGKFFYKFKQIDDKTNKQVDPKKTNSTNSGEIININNTASHEKTFKLIFDVLDSNSDGFIDFYEFVSLMQIGIIYNENDKNGRGTISAGALYDILKKYGDLPSISYKLRERADRFNSFDPNIQVDLLSALQILKIDELAQVYSKKLDPTNLNEIELKNILNKVNMKHVPNSSLNKCLRGIDYNNRPKYDWECTFIQGVTLNLKYFEAVNNYKTVKDNHFTLLNTAFYNIDPSLK